MGLLAPILRHSDIAGRMIRRCGIIDPSNVVAIRPPPREAAIRKGEGSTVRMADKLQKFDKVTPLQPNRKLI